MSEVRPNAVKEVIMNMDKNDTQESAGKDQFVAYQLPPLSLLTEIPAWQKGSTTFDAESTGRLLVHALEAFGIKTELKTFFLSLIHI